MTLSITIPGKVKAKQSARFYVDSYGKIKSYQSQKVKDFADKVKYYFIKQNPTHRASMLKNIPLRVQIIVFMECPQSWSKTRKLRAEYDEIRPIVKPDCDNIAKNILDSLNKIAYPDDKQIVELQIKKFYSMNDERIEVRIGKL